MHIASPFMVVDESNADSVVKPAVEGTQRVLKACAAAGTIKRVIMTSSMAAIMYGWDEPPKNGDTIAEPEKHWSNADKIPPYLRSKTLAEKAGWEFVKATTPAPFELVVINPGYVIGPALGTNGATSFSIAEQLLKRTIPAVPNLTWPCVDVRDVARAHLNAMTVPAAAGERIFAVAAPVYMREMAAAAAAEFDKLGYK